VGKIMDYEYNRGSQYGTGLSNYGNPNLPYGATRDDAIQYVMKNIYPDVNSNSAMEKGELLDFRYNTGKDARVYALSELIREKTGKPWADRNKYIAGMQMRDGAGNSTYDGVWHNKQLKEEFDKIYGQYTKGMSKNTRRQYINKGRDWYYRNINTVNGQPNPAYRNTWYGRIWNTNDYNDYDNNNKKFTPRRHTGGILY
jgi:hypothetical protein